MCGQGVHMDNVSIYSYYIRQTNQYLGTWTTDKAVQIRIWGFFSKLLKTLEVSSFILKSPELREKSLKFLWPTTDARRMAFTEQPKIHSHSQIFKYIRPKHILSTTLALIFRFLWFMPSLGVRTLCFGKSKTKVLLELLSFNICSLAPEGAPTVFL